MTATILTKSVQIISVQKVAYFISKVKLQVITDSHDRLFVWPFETLNIFKLIKNLVCLILDNFQIVGFLSFDCIPMDSSHFSPHFDGILSPCNMCYIIAFDTNNNLLQVFSFTIHTTIKK